MAKSPRTTKSRAWCFTSHDVSDEYTAALSVLDCTYLVYGRETCPETKKAHLQGYVEFKNARHFSAVKKTFGGAHIEPRIATSLEASSYCKKEDPNFYEVGTLSAPGKRNDITAVVEMVKDGMSLEDIIDNTTSHQAFKHAMAILPYKEKKRNWIPYVEWIYGATGTGKTYKAKTDNQGSRIHFQCGSSDRWWSGYDGHPVVIIDDFRKTFCDYAKLLVILDENPFVVECKGGTRQFLARKIYITAPYSPREMYADCGEDIEQLERRITKVVHCTQKYVRPIVTDDAVPETITPSSSQSTPETNSEQGRKRRHEEVC